MLSHVLGVLLRFESAPDRHLAGVLEGLGPNAVLLSVAQPDQLPDAASLWQALGGKMRPALVLVATAPFDAYETRWTKVAREAILALTQGTLGQEPGRRSASLACRPASQASCWISAPSRPLAGVAVRAEGQRGSLHGRSGVLLSAEPAAG